MVGRVFRLIARFPIMYSRRPKESHLDTIDYEIEMLGFCAQAVTHRQHSAPKDRYVYLEGFLLHYRNLIRFFSGEHHRADDLSTSNSAAWAARNLTPDELTAIRVPAKILDTKYFGEISKYLHHCTLLRHDVDRGWDIEIMVREIEPILIAFQNARKASDTS